MLAEQARRRQVVQEKLADRARTVKELHEELFEKETRHLMVRDEKSGETFAMSSKDAESGKLKPGVEKLYSDAGH